MPKEDVPNYKASYLYQQIYTQKMIQAYQPISSS